MIRAGLAGAAAATPSIVSGQDPRTVLDASVLNFLLKFEYVQAALYREALGRFTPANLAPFGATLYQTIIEFHDQENAHVATLRDLVSRLGVAPLPECGTTFRRFNNVPDFLQRAYTIENIGVSAYLGVLPLIRNAQLQSSVASFSSVESRHAAFIGMMNGQSPAPSAADTPRSRADVLALLDPYLGSCVAQD